MKKNKSRSRSQKESQFSDVIISQSTLDQVNYILNRYSKSLCFVKFPSDSYRLLLVDFLKIPKN